LIHRPHVIGNRFIRMNKQRILLFLAVGLLVLAGIRLVAFFQRQREPRELAYYYDLSERKLFVADRALLPPTRGINDDEPDGMRAMVISTNGNPQDKSSHRIAYLETYTPELKQQLEAMRAGKEADAGGPRLTRGTAQSFTLVRRLSEAAWHPVNTPEGERIMTEWLAAGPDGKMPVACTP